MSFLLMVLTIIGLMSEFNVWLKLVIVGLSIFIICLIIRKNI